ncbi:MAG TPA: hypothetical protein PLN21_12560 [Gemmatales bacterium]|nr:hypothetical protein [Gemmatales bacterium]
MNFHGQLSLADTLIIRHLEGELEPQLLDNGKTIYRGHFSCAENFDFNHNDIYLLQTTEGHKTKVKILTLLTDLAGLKVFSMYATHPLK